MAIGLASDFKIYQEEFYGGMFERVAQMIQVFNGASRNTLQLVQKELKGDYNKESFLQDIATLITRRDTTSVSGVTDLPMTQEELVGVKINRKIGPVANTLDSWRKIAKDQREMSFKLGGMIGERKMKDYVNTIIMAVEAALEAQIATNGYDFTGTGTITHGALNTAMSKLGDQSSRIVAFIMHSKVYHDLIGQAITDKITEVAGVTIMQGNVATFGRPTIVTDCPSLFEVGATTTGDDAYVTLGLVARAGVVMESEKEEIVSQVITGLENLIFRVQGEYAFNLNVKGTQWDITNGGANPTDANIAVTTNWDMVATDQKDLAGVRLLTK